MDEITIHTKLDNFILIDRIIQHDAFSIIGETALRDTSIYHAIEILAQLASYHQRFLNNFAKHVFLLMIDSFHLENITKGAILSIKGKVSSHSAQCAQYELYALCEERIMCQGFFTIGLMEYNDKFQKEKLQNFHREIFTCLMNGSN